MSFKQDPTELVRVSDIILGSRFKRVLHSLLRFHLHAMDEFAWIPFDYMLLGLELHGNMHSSWMTLPRHHEARAIQL